MIPAQTDQLIMAIREGVITEQEAIEFMVALKRGDKVAIERLCKEHKDSPECHK